MLLRMLQQDLRTNVLRHVSHCSPFHSACACREHYQAVTKMPNGNRMRSVSAFRGKSSVSRTWGRLDQSQKLTHSKTIGKLHISGSEQRRHGQTRCPSHPVSVTLVQTSFHDLTQAQTNVMKPSGYHTFGEESKNKMMSLKSTSLD